MTDENKDNIKIAFNEWLTQSKDNKIKTTSLTASEYIGRLSRLSQRLYGKEDFQSLQNNIYILHLLFMDSSNWINIETDDLNSVVAYLYSHKHKSRNLNDHYNQFFHSLRKQLTLPLSFSSQHPDFFFGMLKSTEEYIRLSDWIKQVFITEKSLHYLSWLYINKAEKRKIATALLKFSIFLTTTKAISDNVIGLLSKKILWSKRKNKKNDFVQIDEANGVEGRNFYSRYKEGKVEKLLSVQEVTQALGCADSMVRGLIEKGKLNIKPGTKKIIAENVRRFLRRRHTKR
ncbi:MAG: hypothetical protein J6039_01835, partial [Alphaproteobacteria bacterium]|nr:hypothetical protein [Alphaproteobacteria bacterium]